MKLKRRTIWTIGTVAALGVVAVLLTLIAAGILVLPGASPTPVNVTSVEFYLVQGTNASGNPWFGPSPIIYSGAANSLPFTVAPGASFSEALSLENFDNAPHTLYSISAAAPFKYVGSSPALPVVVPALEDSALMDMTFTAPSTPGASVVLVATLSLVPPTQ